MDDYLPSVKTRRKEDGKLDFTRIDQDTWNLVGNSIDIQKLRDLEGPIICWANTDRQQELVTNFLELISEFEKDAYDKLK